MEANPAAFNFNLLIMIIVPNYLSWSIWLCNLFFGEWDNMPSLFAN
ncbi:MAG: hypothetical protein P4L69_18380 [Desulfosporosinus sp.]|nr:hypothetical protein [Desulfosporosinus sp.]